MLQNHFGRAVIGILVTGILIVLYLCSFPALAARSAPSFYIYTEERIFTTQERPYIMVRGSGTLEFTFEVYRFNPFDYTKSGKTLANVGNVPPRDLQFVHRLSETGRPKKGSNYFLLKIPFRTEGPGGYLIKARDKSGSESLTWVIVSDLGIVTKQTRDELMVYAQHFTRGRPFPGVLVIVYAGKDVIASGYTDADGLLRFKGSSLPKNATIAAKYGPNFAGMSSMYYWDEQRHRAYVYTDRPVYRPGQEVFFKGIVREDLGGSYSVLAEEPVTVEVRDSRDASIYRAELTTNEFGSFAGQLTLGREPSLGSYRILTTVRNSTQYAWFEVAEYRKPEYQVNVNSPGHIYIAGDTIPAEILATYYFGAPVANARVTYSVYSQPYYVFYSSPEDEGYYPELDYGDVYYGELLTHGETRTDSSGRAYFSANTARTGGAGGTRRLIIEARVMDESQREVAGMASVILARGDFEIAVRPGSYVALPYQKVDVEVESQTLDGRPISKELKATVSRVTWEGKTTQKWVKSSAKLSTDRDGKAKFEFKQAEEGYYEVSVDGTDKRGNLISTSAYIWVTTDSYSLDSYGGPELEITTDKEVYDRGDVARILVNTTIPDAYALVTVEGTRLHAARIVHFRGHSQTFEVPIHEEYSPNAYFSVSIVSGKRFVSREKPIYISTRDKFLNLEVTPDNEAYAPGEEATYRIKATDSDGQPAHAELSFGLVDASLYAVREEMTQDIRKFFYGARPNRVITDYSFPRWYYGGAEKEGRSSQVRSWFPDTALWRPFVTTDENGEAKVTVKLPDSLTTWRATVRAHTQGTEVGSTTREVRTEKDFFVRIIAPRFLTSKDVTVISTLVHNYTEAPVEAELTLNMNGLEILSPGGADATILIGPGDVGRADWQVKATGVGAATILATANSPGHSDAVEISLPIKPYGVKHRNATAGELDGAEMDRVLEFQVPPEIVPGTANLEVRLSPSIGGAVFGALEYLTSYPYGCVEQTMSSFLPDIVAARALTELGIHNPGIQEVLPKMVNDGLARLYRFQHGDGGWGWWEYDETNSRMTAYVMWGLTLASKAGFAVDPDVMARGKRALYECLMRPSCLDELVYVQYALSATGARDFIRIDEAFRRRDELSNLSKGALALMMANLGRTADARLVLAELRAAAKEGPDVCYWSPGREELWNDNTAETTAYVLRAFLKIEPGDPLTQKAGRWLVNARSGNRWASTKDTAMAVLALLELMKTGGETAPPSQARVYVNGAQAGDFSFSREDLFSEEKVITLEGVDVRPGELIHVRIEKPEGGRLYYAAAFSYYVPCREPGEGQSMGATSQPGSGQPASEQPGSGITITKGYFRREIDRSPRKPQQGPIYTYIPVTGPVRVGEEIFVRLIVTADRDYRYIMIEDPLPSGFEARDDYIDSYSWNFWYGRKEIRDTKVAFASGYLKRGRNEIVYSMRAERPGEYRTPPAELWGMYDTELVARSAPTAITVDERVIASFSTPLKEGELARNANIKLAADAISSMTLAPGEIFSFNERVGPRTPERGYKEAKEIAQGTATLGFGGGICQVSSTLYNVALLAGMKILERHPHSRPVDYVPAGRDATVVEGSLDLKFQNTLNQPVTFLLEVMGNRLTVIALGAKPPGKTIEIETSLEEVVQAGKDGYMVVTWRIIREKRSGIPVEVRECISEDYYLPSLVLEI